MQSDHVREHSPDSANDRIDEELVAAVARYADAPPDVVSQRLRELDEEWDIERRLEANAATISLGAVGLTLVSGHRRWLLLAGLVPAFLLQHAV